VIDTASNQVIAEVLTDGKMPGGIALSSDGKYAYIPNTYDDREDYPCHITPLGCRLTVSVFFTESNSMGGAIDGIGAFPFGAAVSPDGTKLYVPNTYFFQNEQNLWGFFPVVAVIDTAERRVTTRILVTRGGQHVALSPDGNRLYLAGNEVVSVIDTTTNSELEAIWVGQNKSGADVTPDGKRLYVVELDDDAVSVIDTATNSVTATIGVGHFPSALGRFIGPADVPITPPPTFTITSTPTVTVTWTITLTRTITPTRTVSRTLIPTRTVTSTRTITPAPHPPCAGDCDGSGEVTVEDLVLGVGISLGRQSVAACPAFDADMDGVVTINELIAAVNAALHGCAAAVEPTSTPTNTCTPGANPAPGCGYEGPTFTRTKKSVTDTPTPRISLSVTPTLPSRRTAWNHAPARKGSTTMTPA